MFTHLAFFQEQPLHHIQMATSRSHMKDKLVEYIVVRMQPFKHLQVARSARTNACSYIQWVAVRECPFGKLQGMNKRARRCPLAVLLDRTPDIHDGTQIATRHRDWEEGIGID
jgi:hypothetical protein